MADSAAGVGSGGAAGGVGGNGAAGSVTDGAAADGAARTVSTEQQLAFRGSTRLRQRYPTVLYLRRTARRRLPHFAFEYGDGGAGADGAIARNWSALDAVELVPRSCLMPVLPPIETTLFGRQYAAPFGVAPMGGPGIVWPGADRYLAMAAQSARVPYTLATTGGITVEEAAELAPDVLWFQLGRMARDDHRLGMDLVDRAAAAGAHVLALSVDGAVRATRPREVNTGLGGTKFTPGPRMIVQSLRAPGWLWSLARHGIPRFANLRRYAGPGVNDVISLARREIGGAFTWDEVARYRDRWKGPLLLKGVLDPADADRAVSMGVDGIWVSNHGGRQLEALPPPIDVLPAVAAAIGGRATVLMDSGVRSGLDAVRAIAVGADAVFAGKAFLWGLGALGPAGPAHVLDLFGNETRAALGLIGATTPAEARAVIRRHPGALPFPDRREAREALSAPGGARTG